MRQIAWRWLASLPYCLLSVFDMVLLFQVCQCVFNMTRHRDEKVLACMNSESFQTHVARPPSLKKPKLRMTRKK